MQALRGDSSIIEPTFVYLPGIPGGDPIVKATGCEFFSVPVEFDKTGAKQAIDVVKEASDYEKKLLAKCYEGLKGNIENGVQFVKNPPPK